MRIGARNRARGNRRESTEPAAKKGHQQSVGTCLAAQGSILGMVFQCFGNGRTIAVFSTWEGGFPPSHLRVRLPAAYTPPAPLPMPAWGSCVTRVTFVPIQFFSVVVPHCSRGCVRIVGHALRRLLGWVDEHGNPTQEQVCSSSRELSRLTRLSRQHVHEGQPTAQRNDYSDEPRRH